MPLKKHKKVAPQRKTDSESFYYYILLFLRFAYIHLVNMGSGASLHASTESWIPISTSIQEEHHRAFHQFYNRSNDVDSKIPSENELYDNVSQSNEWIRYSRSENTSLNVIEVTSQAELMNGIKSEHVIHANSTTFTTGAIIIAEATDISSLLPFVQAVQSALGSSNHSADQPHTANNSELPLHLLNVGLNVAHTGLSTLSIHEAGATLRRLQYLDIGGNGVESVSDVTGWNMMVASATETALIAGSGANIPLDSPHSPSTYTSMLPMLCVLQVLNLSYTPNLIIDKGCFQSCICLQRLILDGCGIRSTLHEFESELATLREEDEREEDAGQSSPNDQQHMVEDDHIVRLLTNPTNDHDELISANAGTGFMSLPQLRQHCCLVSIFTGLTNLKELSLAENNLRSYHSLCGLSALPRLESISLIDNPLRQQSQRSRFVDSVLLLSPLGPGHGHTMKDSHNLHTAHTVSESETAISTLQYVDGKNIRFEQPIVVDKTSELNVLGRSMNPGIVGVGGEAAVEGLEREVQMHLHGQKDVSVVA